MPATPPSVVLVVVDTLRADHLGVYGYERDVSARLDARSDSAAIFEQAVAPSPWTLPSMGSILTGLYPARHGAGLRADFAREPDRGDFAVEMKPRRLDRFSRLREDVPALAQILSDAGFATAATVTNPFLKPTFRVDRGFASYDAPKENLRGRTADWVVDRALEEIERLPRPYFLLVHLYDPHVPYGAPEPFAGRYSGDYDGRLAAPFKKVRQVRRGKLRLNPDDHRFLTDLYDEEIAYVDAELERLWTRLLDRPEDESTVVVLTSDHGEELFEHGGFEHGHSVYQEVLRVPLVIWGPGVAAGWVQSPVSLVDLAPTILEAVGLKPPAGLDGRSLWPVLESGVEPAGRPVAAQWNLYGEELSAVVDWPLKLVLGPGGAPKNLFDLETDPGERRDLLGDRPEEVARLRSVASTMIDPAGAATGEAAEIDEEIESQLEALGYLD